MMNKISAVLAATLAGLATLTVPDAIAQGRPLSTAMTGAAEVPGPGDPDGMGEIFLTLNQGRGEICFQMNVTDIAPAVAAHIHEAPVGVAGPVVVPLVPPPTGGFSSACLSVDRDLVKEIAKRPQDYYVNVHNAEFPAGAIRGQLSK